MTNQPQDAPPLVVEEADQFEKLAKRLVKTKRLAVDTEAASYHRYFDRIYLIQLTSPELTAIVDPLGVQNLDALRRIFTNAQTELVFHDADYDLRVMDRDYGFRVNNLFDTRVAAQLLGEPGVGLGALLNKYFGLVLDKKMQRADWSRRPLTDEMISYAANDTRHLLQLRDVLEDRLRQLSRHHWALEEFRRLEDLRWTGPQEEPAFLRIKGAKKLTPKTLAVLRAIHEWRDRTARDLDWAPFRVLGNDAMVAIAKAAPSSLNGLSRVKGVPASALRRYGDDLYEAVSKGRDTAPTEYPRPERGKRPKMTRSAEMRLERLKLLRNRRAKLLEIESGVLCPNGTLQSIARAAPTDFKDFKEIDGLRRWQIEALGEDELVEATAGKRGN